MNTLLSKLRALGKDEQKTQQDESHYWWSSLTKTENSTAVKEELASEISTRVISLSGHTGSVTALVYNKRNNTLVSSSFDGTIRIWDLYYKKLLQTLQAHDGSVTSLVLSLKTNILVSSGSDGTIKTWDLDEPMFLRAYSFRPGGLISSVCLSPNEDYVVAVGDSGVTAWNFETEEEWSSADPGLWGGQCVAVASQHRVYSGHDDGAVRFWQVGDHQEKHGELGRHSGLVTGVQLLPDESILISCSVDQTVRVWRTVERVCLQNLYLGQHAVSCMLFSPPMQTLYLGDTEGEMLTYELHGEFIFRMEHKIHARDIMSFCLDDLGNMFSASMDRVIKFWEIKGPLPELVYSFEGHSDSVECFALDRAEKYLASAGMDSQIRIWDLDNRQPLVTLSGHSSRITSVVFTRISEVLFSASDDGTIRLWSFDGDTSKQVSSIHEHIGSVFSLALNDKCSVLASGGADCTIKLWNVKNLEKIGELLDHTKPVMALLFDPSDKLLYSGSADSTIKVWDLKRKVCIETFSSHLSTVYKIVYCPVREAIFSASRDKTITWLSLIERCQKKKYVGHKEEVLDVTVSTDGNTLYSASRDRTIKIWNVVKGECINTLIRHTEAVTMIHKMSRYPALISSSEDKSLILWNFDKPDGRTILQDHTEQINGLQLIYSDQVLVSSSNDGKVIYRSLQDNKILRVVDAGSPVCSAYSAADDDTVTVATRSKGIQNWSLSEQTMISKPELSHDSTNCMLVTQEDQMMFSATATAPYNIVIIHRRSGHSVRVLEGHTKLITCIDYLRSREILMSASMDRTIRIWDITNHSLITVLKGHSEAVNCVIADEKGQFLYSASVDKTIRVWQLQDYSMMTTLEGHEAEVTCIKLDTHSTILFSGSSDCTIKAWSTIDFRCIVTLSDNPSPITSLVLSYDECFLYSGHQNGEVRIWNFNTYTDFKGLDLNLLQNLQTYAISESMQEKIGSLLTFIACLKQSGDEHYIHRVYPTLFAASVPFTEILKKSLEYFGYPSLHCQESQDLFRGILKDDQRRTTHLDTIADYFYDNPESMRLTGVAVHEIIPTPNLKLQSVMSKMFELNPEPQQGAFLQTKGILKRRPNCIPISTTRLVSNVALAATMKKDKAGQAIKYSVLKLPIDLRNGSEGSRDLMRGLQECNEEVILSQFKHIINYKWKRLRTYVLLHACGFWTLCIGMSMYIFYLPGNFIVMILLLVLNGIYIAYEITGALGEYFSYIFQDMNWVDLAVLSLNCVIVVLFYAHPNHSYIYLLVLLDFFMYFLRAITFLRVFQSTRYLISTILKVFTDILSLMLISFLFLFGFSMLAVNVSFLDGDPDTAATFWNSFQPLYILFAGDIDTSQVQNYYDRVQYLLASIVLKLVMYNLNISIVENAYQEVKSNQEYFELMEKLQIVGDFENFLYKLRRIKSTPSDYKYHLIAYYPEKETDESLLAGLYRQVLQLEKHILAVFEVVEEKLETTYQMLRVNRKNAE